MEKLPILGFGIVGTGMVADFHARAIKEARGARLVGCADQAEDRARRFAEKHGVEFMTGRIEDLVSRADIQVICITTPSGAHLEPALAAIRAGKHLVVEKPLEITLERADALLRAADRAGVRVAAILQNRFGAGAKMVKAAVDAGRFGRLVLCSAYVKWYRGAEYYRGGWHGTRALDGGGALMNQGIHGVDLLQWFAGMPAEVSAWTARCVHGGIEAEDTVAAALRFANGGLGVIEASTACYPGWARRIEICGESGSAVLEDDRVAYWKFREPLPGDEEVVSPVAGKPADSGAAAPDSIGHQRHLLQIQDMIDSLQTGRPLAVDGRAARNAVAVIRAIYDSASTRMPVRLI